MLDNELYLCRRTHSNKTAFPANLKPNKQEVKALCRGESLYRRQGNIVVTVWKDKKLVSFISTQCDVRGDETVRRKQKDGTYIEVPTIPAVTLCNKYMGGVDRNDQMQQYYETSRRARKWWRYLFWFCLDVTIVNAYILMQIADKHPHLTQLEFRIELVNALIREFSSRQHNVHEGAVQTGH